MTKIQNPQDKAKINISEAAFPRLMLKKIKREIRTGQSILHISNKQNAITDLLFDDNLLSKVSTLDENELKNKNIFRTQKAFTYIILDLDMPCSDNLEALLNQIAPMIIRPGLLILIGTNLCSFKSKLKLLFNNAPEEFQRPSRAIAPNQLREIVIKEGFFLKNRYYQYGNRLMMFLDIPKRY